MFAKGVRALVIDAFRNRIPASASWHKHIIWVIDLQQVFSISNKLVISQNISNYFFLFVFQDIKAKTIISFRFPKYISSILPAVRHFQYDSITFIILPRLQVSVHEAGVRRLYCVITHRRIVNARVSIEALKSDALPRCGTYNWKMSLSAAGITTTFVTSFVIRNY